MVLPAALLHSHGAGASGKVSPMSKLSLDRILQSQGFGTRKYCRSLIEEGDVVIAGEVQSDYRATIDTEQLVLHVFDEAWVYREHVYIAINKPANIECS